jgi:hypothetical protein
LWGTSLFDPAEIDEETVGFSERLGVGLAFTFIEEGVASLMLDVVARTGDIASSQASR